MSRYGDIAAVSSYHDIVNAGRNVLNARSLPRLGRSVRRLRLDRGLSQSELADRAGVSRQWVVGLERGQTEGLEVGRLMRVLDELDASLTIRDDLGAD
ncbi:helix-turn-helix domain-containing protein [Myceligenerans xiligouense]|uniref:helix-turn-helix domain-containing protein n=1 Tax=Myceligenerans xiligouense TaxID=253184 RepID=UPI001FE48696|nr:helix-turn-helix transcriptional regulator [Myceligenerans xiligouense]